MSYASTVLATSGLVSYWRLGEPSGTSAADSFGSNTGTYTNSPTLGSSGLILGDTDTAVTFSRASLQYVALSTTTIFTSASFSIEAWLKPADLAANSIYFEAWTADALGQNIHLRLQTTGKILFGYYLDDLQGNTVLAAGSVYHVVVTYDSGTDTSSIYINGILDVSGAQGPFTGVSPVVKIGTGRGEYFNGVIDEVAIYNAALSAATVLAHYTAGTTPPVIDGAYARDFTEHTFGPF